MTKVEKLNQIYLASRLAPLNADQHEVIRKLATELAQEIDDKKTPEKIENGH